MNSLRCGEQLQNDSREETTVNSMQTESLRLLRCDYTEKHLFIYLSFFANVYKLYYKFLYIIHYFWTGKYKNIIICNITLPWFVLKFLSLAQY